MQRRNRPIGMFIITQNASCVCRPMDIATIKRKLDSGSYKTREEFCDDVRLIFANCEVFNEDDSPVGKAGHAMRHLFDTR